MKKKHYIFCWTGVLFLFLFWQNAMAATVDLDFNSLPSAQGWSFVKSTTGSHANDTEAGTFSLVNGSLACNTLGTGLASPSGLAYRMEGVIDPDRDWNISWTMKITGYEQGSNDNNFGAWFAIYNGTSVVGLALSGNELSVYQSGDATGLVSGWSTSARYPTAMDKTFNTTDDFHSYGFSYVADGSTGFGTWVFYIDGVANLTGTSQGSTGVNGLTMGDGTGDANASWLLSHYEFNQAPSSVPVPGTLLLSFCGLLGICFSQRKH